MSILDSKVWLQSPHSNHYIVLPAMCDLKVGLPHLANKNTGLEQNIRLHMA